VDEALAHSHGHDRLDQGANQFSRLLSNVNTVSLQACALVVKDSERARLQLPTLLVKRAAKREEK